MKDKKLKKKIVDFYKGKDVTKADALLIETAENNFKVGYNKAIEDVKKIIKNLEFRSLDGYIWINQTLLLGKLEEEKKE